MKNTKNIREEKERLSHEKSLNKTKSKNIIFYFLIFWIVFALIIFLITKSFMTVLGVFIASVISLLIYIKKINEQWQGTIVDIKNETYYDKTNDIVRNIKYMYIKLYNGKTKKMKHITNWKIGDKIIKVKGEYSYKNISLNKQN